jgi:hypothetical protein
MIRGKGPHSPGHVTPTTPGYHFARARKMMGVNSGEVPDRFARARKLIACAKGR